MHNVSNDQNDLRMWVNAGTVLLVRIFFITHHSAFACHPKNKERQDDKITQMRLCAAKDEQQWHSFIPRTHVHTCVALREANHKGSQNIAVYDPLFVAIKQPTNPKLKKTVSPKKHSTTQPQKQSASENSFLISNKKLSHIWLVWLPSRILPHFTKFKHKWKNKERDRKGQAQTHINKQ